MRDEMEDEEDEDGNEEVKRIMTTRGMKMMMESSRTRGE